MSDRGTIGRRIREGREQSGFTQAQLAEAVGIDDTALSRIEKGERGIDSLVLRQIAQVLELPLDSFFTERRTFVLARNGVGDEMEPMVRWAQTIKSDLRFVRDLSRRYE
jgi:transcriptional regulator with XRE-family HTH domain